MNVGGNRINQLRPQIAPVMTRPSVKQSEHSLWRETNILMITGSGVFVQHVVPVRVPQS